MKMWNRESATELHLAAGIVEPESTESWVLKAWGADLEQRRKSAGLTRKVLADRAGFSESTQQRRDGT